MTNKFLPTSALVCASLLLIPAASHACENMEKNLLERGKTALSDLSRAGADATLYNYRTQHCASLANAHNELEISAFLPSDETSLGIYQAYRDRGESQINALQHTLEFMVNEQQS